MPSYTDIIPDTNPYFTETSSNEGMGSLGAGNGTDWIDWTQLPSEITSSFLTPRDTSQGAYRGSGYSPQYDFSLSGLKDYLASSGNTLKEANQDSFWSRGMFDPSGKVVGQTQQGYSGGFDPAFALGSMFLNPFGGVVAGGAAGGVGASLGMTGRAAQAFNSGVTGGLSAAGSGGNPLRGAAAGGLSGGYTPDVSGGLGLGNGILGQTVNGAVKGGVQGYLSGGNPLQSATMGGVVSGLNSLGGGTKMDDYGYSRAPWATGNSPSFEEGATYGSSPAPWSAPTMNFMPNEQASTSANPLNDFLGKLIPQTPERLGDLAQGLAGIYSGYRRRNMASDLMKRIGGNRDSYLANLRGQLTARDARSGRRSNIGGREVELQAKLAELDSRNAPALMAMSDARLGGLDQMLSSGLRLGGNMGLFGDRYSRPLSTMDRMPSYNVTMPEMPTIQSPVMSLDDTTLSNLGRRGRVYGGY